MGESAFLEDAKDSVESPGDGLRTRSLNDPRQDAIAQRCSPVLTLDRETVTRLSPPRHLHQVQTVQPSPSARQFRLLFNGLAAAELRRMFCSDEGACVRFGGSRGAIVVPGACPSRGGGQHYPGG
jgi:hypothetical protein